MAQVVPLVSWTVLRDRFRRHHAPADGQAWMKDYGLGPLVEGKAWFNQNVQKIKKKVIMNVQLKTLSSILQGVPKKSVNYCFYYK